MFYKKIKLDHIAEISQQLLDIIPEEVRNQTSLRNVDLDKLKSLDLLWEEISKIGFTKDDLLGCHVITVSPESSMPIHTDGGKAATALNWPVLGMKGTRTVFYKLRDPDTANILTHPLPDGGNYSTYDEKDVEEVDMVQYVDHPILINVHSIHTVVNPNPGLRTTVSIRFRRPLFDINE